MKNNIPDQARVEFQGIKRSLSQGGRVLTIGKPDNGERKTPRWRQLALILGLSTIIFAVKGQIEATPEPMERVQLRVETSTTRDSVRGTMEELHRRMEANGHISNLHIRNKLQSSALIFHQTAVMTTSGDVAKLFKDLEKGVPELEMDGTRVEFRVSSTPVRPEQVASLDIIEEPLPVSTWIRQNRH